MRKIAFILLGITLIFSACTKEGPRGPQGLPGSQGASGSAPALYYFDIPVNQYQKELYVEDNSQFYNDAWLAYAYIEGVTIQENDLVMAFMHQTTDGGQDNYFQALPYSDYIDNSAIFNHYSYGVMDDNGDLVFSIRRSNGEAPFDNMNAIWAIHYNVYIVKGSVNKKASIPASVNVSNEKELKSYLGIQEAHKVKLVLR